MLCFYRSKGLGELKMVASPALVLPGNSRNVMMIGFLQQHFILLVQIGNQAILFPDFSPDITICDYCLAFQYLYFGFGFRLWQDVPDLI